MICFYIWLHLRWPAMVLGTVWLTAGVLYGARKKTEFRTDYDGPVQHRSVGDRRDYVSGGGVVVLCNLLRHVEKSMGNRSMNEPNVTRRSFLRAPAAAAALAGVAPFLLSAQSSHGAGLAGAAIPQAGGARDDVVIERDLPSKPNAGKVQIGRAH